VSRGGEPESLPSLRSLGDRLNEAVAREISSERRGRRVRRRRPWILLGIAGALVVAGGAAGTGVFTGAGEPIPSEPSTRDAPLQSGVLADSAAPDPVKGALPWAIRVFSDNEGRECMQLGRLSGGRLGTVISGQFRPYAGNPVGSCGDLAKDGVLLVLERRAQPERRTILYGMSAGRAPITVTLAGGTRRVTPGALGGFVVVFGELHRHGATVRTTVDGRPFVRRL
jgi:hypothetical protein